MKFRKLVTPVAVALIGMPAFSGCSAWPSPAEAKPIEVVLPDALTVPGSSVAVGETLRVPGLALTDDNAASGYEPAELGLTVTDVTWPGTAMFDDFGNGDEFASYEPVVIAYQVDSPANEERFKFRLGDLYGILSDGEYAEQLQGDYGFESGGIGHDLDQLCYQGELPDPWTSELRCTVILVPDGQTLGSLGWNALGFNESNHLAADDPRSPYVSAPLIFKVSKP